MSTQTLFKKIEPQFVWEKFPKEIKEFWHANIKDGELFLFETNHCNDVLDSPIVFSIYKETKNLHRYCLCQGHILYDGKMVAKYLFDNKYYPEDEFIKILKLKIFW